jgi:large subunit ribosomal protein L10
MRPEKTSIINEIRTKVKESEFIILANYQGMNVGQMKELRKRLLKQKSRLQVVKNSYFKKAMTDMPDMKLEEKLKIPMAMVTGKGDGVEAARILNDFKKEFNVTSILFGFLYGRRFSESEFEQVIALPSRPVLLGMLAGGLLAPINGMVNVLHQKLSSIVYVLEAIHEAKSKANK